MRIRAVREADAPAVWAIIGPIIRGGAEYALERDMSEADAIAYWHGADRETYVAEVDGEVLGTYYIVRNQKGGGSHVCNCGYVTAPAAQGRGVARAMLAHSLDIAPDLGFRAMQYNFVVSTNTRAIETWQRAGFEVVGRLPGAFLHPDQGYVDALVMYRELGGAAENPG